MRPSAVLPAILVTATLAGVAQAAVPTVRSPNAQTLSLARGRGLAIVALKGSILGRLRRGRVIVMIPERSSAVAHVYGAEHKHRLNAHAMLYRGSRLRYRIFGGRWRIRLRGGGVNAGAAGRGWFGLDGDRGTYSIAGRSPRHWPSAYRTFDLGI